MEGMLEDFRQKSEPEESERLILGDWMLTNGNLSDIWMAGLIYHIRLDSMGLSCEKQII